jgi:hypothetical protein
MSFSSFLAPWRSRPARSRGPAPVRLSLEALEGREVPSAALPHDLNPTADGALVAGEGNSALQSAPWMLRAEGALTMSPDGSLTLSWSGEASHLGRYTASATFVLDADGRGNTGTGTYVAADGALLYFSYHTRYQYVLGTQWPNTFTGHAVITGGTGRFANASGFADYSGIGQADLTFTFSHDDAQLSW